jgi:predicted DsbA family dithiol-disulfide isomerase
VRRVGPVVRIEIWADVVCPWCYIGKRRLEKALASFDHRDEVEVVYRSYELDPFAPEVGTESTVQVLGRKLGADEAATRAMMAQADEVAAAEGLHFSHADALHARTLSAHRLLHLARAEGSQHALLEEVLAAYFTRGESLGDHDVLRRAAAAAGLDATRVEEVLGSDEFRDEVMADVAQARAYGSTGVPFFVVDGRFGISGAQPTELFEQALTQAWESRELA